MRVWTVDMTDDEDPTTQIIQVRSSTGFFVEVHAVGDFKIAWLSTETEVVCELAWGVC